MIETMDHLRAGRPTLMIEYAPQEQGGSAINHMHAVYRDPTNDYGVKLVG